MGKSTVAGMFAELGVPVFDADQVVRSMQGPGGALVPLIEQAFPGTTGSNGIDRAKVGAAVFDDSAALARLEAIVHPAVRQARAEFMRDHAKARLVVLDIPLLFERGGIEEVDAVVVVSAPRQVQRERVLARPGMTLERFKRILALQLSDAKKRTRADYVIDTGTSLAETRAEVARLVEKLIA
jgi:dephospho-CoA kinase